VPPPEYRQLPGASAADGSEVAAAYGVPAYGVPEYGAPGHDAPEYGVPGSASSGYSSTPEYGAPADDPFGLVGAGGYPAPQPGQGGTPQSGQGSAPTPAYGEYASYYGQQPAEQPLLVPPPPTTPGPFGIPGQPDPNAPRQTEEGIDKDRLHFRRDIEGLRAVAVMAVLLFHIGLPAFGGGFVGVDIFYVISGFLITGLLLREGEQTGKVDLVRFYARRMRRLLPAGLLVIIVTLVLSALIVTPLRLSEIAGDAAASALYVANFRFALDATNYLATEAPSPLLHYWSLGVEEQFYLVWPLLLLIALRLLPGRLVGAFLLLLAIGSFALSFVWTTSDPQWAFFSPITRAWELAAGALVAIGLLRVPKRAPGFAAGILVTLGLLLIVASVVAGPILLDLGIGDPATVTAIFATPESPFPGIAALLPVVGATIIIVGGSHSRTVLGRFVLGNPVSRYLGHISYSLYLWHWPLLILVPIAMENDELAFRFVLAGVAILLAAITTEVVEQPFRRSGALQRRSGGTVQLGLSASVAVGVVGLLMAGAITLPSNINLPWLQPDREVLQLAGVRDDLPAHYGDDCNVTSYKQKKLRTDCVYGDADGTRTAMLVGDSHAAQWMPALDPYAESKGWRLEVHTKSACAVTDVPVWERNIRREFEECTAWRDSLLAHIKETQPEVVFVGLSRDYDLWSNGRVVRSRDAMNYWQAQLISYLDTLRRSADRVVLLAETPFLNFDPVDCLADTDIASCDPPSSIVVDHEYAILEETAADAAGAKLLSATDLLCPARTCPVYADDLVVFRDAHHVTASYMAHLAEPIGNILEGRAPYPTPHPSLVPGRIQTAEDPSA
jgi:peptidoglycan/LPS O-acetylase OafA/YrhL